MTMISMNYLSKCLMRYTHVNVILPHEEMHPDRCAPTPWKTVYFLHGYTENADHLASTVELERIASQYGIAVVVPDGENSFYMNCPDRNANYEDMVSEELVEVTRKLFPLSERYEDTWIGGFSMGGFGALMIGLRHSDRFSKIVAFSPACNPYGEIGGGHFPMPMLNALFGSEENYYANFDPLAQIKKRLEDGKTLPQMFLRCGNEDHLVKKLCREFHESVKALNVGIDYRECEGDHTPECVNQVLPEGMEFLLGE